MANYKDNAAQEARTPDHKVSPAADIDNEIPTLYSFTKAWCVSKVGKPAGARWTALVSFINAWGAKQRETGRQEGRREATSAQHAVGSFLYVNGEYVATSSDDPRGIKLYAPEQEHIPVRPGHFPLRDPSMPAEKQGVFKKFDVWRTDGSSGPGGKHRECRYFVLDVDHDKLAKPALQAYASACLTTYPDLSADMVKRFDLSPVPTYRNDPTIQGMADCMDLVRQELIEAGVIGADVAPMFIANAVVAKLAAQVPPVAVPDGMRSDMAFIAAYGQEYVDSRSPDQLRALTMSLIARANRALFAAPAAQRDAQDAERLAIEEKAQEIYSTWQSQPEFVAWQHGGNSHMQERARDMARVAIAKATT